MARRPELFLPVLSMRKTAFVHVISRSLISGCCAIISSFRVNSPGGDQEIAWRDKVCDLF